MKLFYREFGSGRPMVILHGMLEMSDNWLPIAKYFSKNFRVIVPDQRNHGKSPHSHEHTHQLMMQDLAELVEDLDLDKIILIGYSMGGRVSMLYAQDYGQNVDKLIIVDVSARSYTQKEFSNVLNLYRDLKKLLDFDLSKMQSRKQIEQALEQLIENPNLVQVLLKNIASDNGKFRWKFNLPALIKYMETPSQAYVSLQKAVAVPALLIYGEKSPFVKEQDLQLMKKFFVNLQATMIKDATHLLPYEKPNELIGAIEKFVKNS